MAALSHAVPSRLSFSARKAVRRMEWGLLRSCSGRAGRPRFAGGVARGASPGSEELSAHTMSFHFLAKFRASGRGEVSVPIDPPPCDD